MGKVEETAVIDSHAISHGCVEDIYDRTGVISVSTPEPERRVL